MIQQVDERKQGEEGREKRRKRGGERKFGDRKVGHKETRGGKEWRGNKESELITEWLMIIKREAGGEESRKGDRISKETERKDNRGNERTKEEKFNSKIKSFFKQKKEENNKTIKY